MLGRERIIIPYLMLAVCLLHLSCSSRSTLRGLEILNSETRDSSLVRSGRASGAMKVVSSTEKHVEILQALDRAVGEHQERLERWAFDLTGLRVKGFRFTFAATRNVDSALVVRYFASTVDMHPIYAGVQVQFLVSTDERELMGILFDRVPYEL